MTTMNNLLLVILLLAVNLLFLGIAALVIIGKNSKDK